MNLPTYITGNTQTTAYRLLRSHVHEVLEQYELTPTYWSMLGIITIAIDGVRQVEIAHDLGVKEPMITTMAKQLKNRGLIQIVPNQFDARAKLLALTSTGKKFMKTVDADLNKELAKLLEGLTEADLNTYNKVLQTIIDNDSRLN